MELSKYKQTQELFAFPSATTYIMHIASCIHAQKEKNDGEIRPSVIFFVLHLLCCIQFRIQLDMFSECTHNQLN